MSEKNACLEYLQEFDYLQTRAQLRTPHAGIQMPYRNHEHFLIERGFNMPLIRQRLPANVSRGAPKECFRNALLTALRWDLIYCEGVAQSYIPTHHGWCLDPDSGEVIDPTWKPVGTCYWGVPFSTSWAWEQTSKNGFYGLFNHHIPHVRGEWDQEEFIDPRWFDLQARFGWQNPTV